MDYIPIVINATYVDGYKIDIVFNNGEKKIVDCAKWLDGGIFEPLKDKNEFKKFFVDGWTIAWPNGADISPETLYQDS